ncbi:MAG TPA: acyl-CoA dehydrogenase family protein [Pseudonocardiaceae bacterium]|jgi:3-hydroxy-9,10-secoandrosta-1,3,5(10)-triene-9,17-dione monooxygenase|nr:acyl-CoA dehydrogenase family protein [Pseudonocardiaceae bacterium]
MTVARIGPANGYPSPPEPGLTPDEAVSRAERIAATLVDRQAETEQRGFYALDTHNEFLRAGLYRLLVPRRYGGYEFDLGTNLRVVSALARGCPSTGWMYAFGATHAHLAATLFGESAQDDLFADGDFISPATVTPVGFAERAPDGGWIIDGVHRYSSGSPYATHFIGHTLVAGGDDEPPLPMMFVVPRAQWRRLDDWGAQLGLKGSGSHSVEIENAHIPEYFGLPGMHMGLATVVEGTAGQELHGNPMYGGGVLSSLQFQLGALSVGMATGALDAYADLMRSRETIFPPIVLRAEDPDYQFHYGEAAGRIAAAEAALMGARQQWEKTAAAGVGAFTREVDLRLATICREVVRLCWTAVSEHLFPTAGSSAVRAGARIERVWRDMSTLHSHAGVSIFLNTVANRELTKAVFDVAA